MKKDIEWLKGRLRMRKLFKPQTEEEIGYNMSIDEFSEYVDQLDEPVTLSQKGIDKNHFEIDNWHEDLVKSDGETSIDHTPQIKVIAVQDLQNAIVSKPELPVVPKWFDEWWKDVSKGSGGLFHNIDRFYDELFSSGTREMYNYISSPDNKQKLLNIIVNELDYVVEEEQKYIVSDNSSIPLLIKNDSGEIMSYDSQIAYNNSNGTIELTEQEIKSYDERYMTFAKPVEEIEK